MKLSSLFIFLSFIGGFANTALAAEATEYKLATQENPGVTFKIGYSLGVHDGSAQTMNSSVKLTKDNKILSGHFVVPISSMTTGNSKRDCHMIEALGIDYSKSQFPKEHVCDGDKMPTTGPDAVAFENIEFNFVSLKADENSGLPAVLEEGKVYNLPIQGKWTIHGITQEVGGAQSDEVILAQVKLLNAATGELQLFAKFNLSLQKFGVVVKPFKIAFVSIGVDDIAKVTLNTRMVRK